MGQYANKMALDLFFWLKQKVKSKKEAKLQQDVPVTETKEGTDKSDQAMKSRLP